MNASFHVKALVFFFIRVVSSFLSYILKKKLFQNLALRRYMSKYTHLSYGLNRIRHRHSKLLDRHVLLSFVQPIIVFTYPGIHYNKQTKISYIRFDEGLASARNISLSISLATVR